MPYKVEIISVNIIPVETPEGTIDVVRVCYRWGDVVTRCVWIDKEEFSEENLKKLIKQDLEAYLRQKRGVLAIE